VTLQDVWFVLFVLVIAGYLILDGFDIGVGLLHVVIAKTDEERRILLNSIGPVWDGNEVWIVIGGGVLFAAFPLVYASLFSGFYVALMLVLLMLILRTAAVEFRSKRPDAAWRRTWDWTFAATSLGLAVLLGVAFGNIIAGVDLNSSGDIETSFIELLNPYALLVGVTAVALFALHGALFLAMKTDDDLQLRVRRAGALLTAVVFGLVTVTVVMTAVFESDVSDRFFSDYWLLILPAAALVAFVCVWRESRRERDFRAFVASGALIALLVASGAAGLYPNLLISSIDENYNLTIDNASAASNSLQVMLVAALIGMPLVLLYTVGVYYFFRGKTRLGPDSY
jgi:cytochrome d ubiquinol oxidase subunit II